jgi:DNA-directed RNA polymerase subunit RPC12/RpoP
MKEIVYNRLGCGTLFACPGCGFNRFLAEGGGVKGRIEFSEHHIEVTWQLEPQRISKVTCMRCGKKIPPHTIKRIFEQMDPPSPIVGQFLEVHTKNQTLSPVKKHGR